MFILVNFGMSKNGLWNMKRFNYPTILEAVEAGEVTTKNEDGIGFVVIASYYEDGKNRDEMKVVYEENTSSVNLQVFPYIGVTVKKVAQEMV
jgi:hypothetical protein